MKRGLILLMISLFAFSLAACGVKSPDEPEADIFKAGDYALSVFRDTMPEEYTVVSATSSVGDVVDDDIYHITLTYTIGNGEEQYSHRYKIMVAQDEFTLLEETSLSDNVRSLAENTP